MAGDADYTKVKIGLTVDVRAVERGDRGTSQELERADQVSAKDLDGARDAGFARRPEPVRVRAPDKDGAGSQAAASAG